MLTQIKNHIPRVQDTYSLMKELHQVPLRRRGFLRKKRYIRWKLIEGRDLDEA